MPPSLLGVSSCSPRLLAASARISPANVHGGPTENGALVPQDHTHNLVSQPAVSGALNLVSLGFEHVSASHNPNPVGPGLRAPKPAARAGKGRRGTGKLHLGWRYPFLMAQYVHFSQVLYRLARLSQQAIDQSSWRRPADPNPYCGCREHFYFDGILFFHFRVHPSWVYLLYRSYV
ncbi:hypothetical protein B0H11DRAFT_312120 [Mycena galericulata]|nr:hypothetical protein B0H11DRAFT_312120 [Mycena galericulata]